MLSTIRNLIVDRLVVSVNIDPDALARRIDSENPERHQISAGKEAIKLVRECKAHQRDFTAETADILRRHQTSLENLIEHLELSGDERTQRKIAKELGISRSYVSRIEKRALMKLYHEFYKAKK